MLHILRIAVVAAFNRGARHFLPRLLIALSALMVAAEIVGAQAQTLSSPTPTPPTIAASPPTSPSCRSCSRRRGLRRCDGLFARATTRKAGGCSLAVALRTQCRPPQLAASSMDGCVDDQDYNDGAQNDHPIGKLDARYRCLFAKPFHDYPSPRAKRDGKFEAEDCTCLSFLYRRWPHPPVRRPYLDPLVGLGRDPSASNATTRKRNSMRPVFF